MLSRLNFQGGQIAANKICPEQRLVPHKPTCYQKCEVVMVEEAIVDQEITAISTSVEHLGILFRAIAITSQNNLVASTNEETDVELEAVRTRTMEEMYPSTIVNSDGKRADMIPSREELEPGTSSSWIGWLANGMFCARLKATGSFLDVSKTKLRIPYTFMGSIRRLRPPGQHGAIFVSSYKTRWL